MVLLAISTTNLHELLDHSNQYLIAFLIKFLNNIYRQYFLPEWHRLTIFTWCYLVTSSVLSCCHGCHVAHCLEMRANYPGVRARAPHHTCVMWNCLMSLMLWFSLYVADNVCFYEVPGLRQITWHAVLSPPPPPAGEMLARMTRASLVPEEDREPGPCGVFISEIIRWPDCHDPASPSSRQTISQTITFVVCDLRLW